VQRRRAIAGFALFVLWLAFLSLYLVGDSYCYDSATGNSGIDALGHCATHEPLGLPLVIGDGWAFLSFAVVPLALGMIWWPYRPTRPGSRDA
jgi:hypothetical protein